MRVSLKNQNVKIDPEHWQKCLNRDILNLYSKDKDEAKEFLLKSLLEGVVGD